MTSFRASMPFEDFILQKEKNNTSALFAPSMFREVERFNAATEYNQRVKQEYIDYLNKKYSDVPLEKQLRGENLSEEQRTYERIKNAAKDSDYDLNNGMFALTQSTDGTGYEVVKATQSSLNRAMYFMSGQSNRKTLLGFATTGIARTYDAQNIYTAPEWARPMIEDILQQAVGGDILQALEEDFQGVNAFTGFFNDIARAFNPERDMKFIGKDPSKYLDALEYIDESWNSKAKDEFFQKIQEDPSWSTILDYAGVDRESIERSNNIAHAQYIINSTINGQSLSDIAPSFSSTTAFLYMLPMSLADDPETALEVTLSGAAVVASAIVPPVAFVAATGFTLLMANRLNKVRKAATQYSRVQKSLAVGTRAAEATFRGIGKVNKIINPFEVFSEYGITSLYALRDVAQGRAKFSTAFKSTKARAAVDRGYDWRMFLLGSALEGGISEFGVYFANLDASIEVADLVYGEGNHVIGFDLGQLVADVSTGAGFGVMLGSTMRGMFAGATKLGQSAFTPLATRISNRFGDDDSIWMRALDGYQRITFQAHAYGTVDLENAGVVESLDEALFDSNDSLISKGFGKSDILEASRLVGKQWRESGNEGFMEPGVFVDHVRRIAEANQQKLLMASHHAVAFNKKTIRKNQKEIDRLAKAKSRAKTEDSKNGIQKKITKLENSNKDLREFQVDAAKGLVMATKALSGRQAKNHDAALAGQEPEVEPLVIPEDGAESVQVEAAEAAVSPESITATPSTPEQQGVRAEASVETNAKLNNLRNYLKEKGNLSALMDQLAGANERNVDALAKALEADPNIDAESIQAFRDYVKENGTGPDMLRSDAPDVEAPTAEPTPAPAAPEDTSPASVSQEIAKDTQDAAAERKAKKDNEKKSPLRARLSQYTPTTMAQRIVEIAKTYHTRRKLWLEKVVKKMKADNQKTISLDMAIAHLPEAEFTFRDKAVDNQVPLSVFEKAINRTHELNMEATESANFDNINRFLLREAHGNDRDFDMKTSSEQAFTFEVLRRLDIERELRREGKIGRRSLKEMQELRKKLQGIKPTNDSTKDIPKIITIEDFLASKGERRAIMESRLLTEAVSSILYISEKNGDGRVSFNDIVRALPPGFEIIAEQLKNSLRAFGDGRFETHDVTNEIVALGLQRQLNKDYAHHYDVLVGYAPNDASIIIARSENREVRDEALTILDHLGEEVNVGSLLARRRQEESGEEYNGASSGAGWNQLARSAGRAALQAPNTGIRLGKLEDRYGTLDADKIVDSAIDEFNQEFAEYGTDTETPFMGLGNGTLDFIDPVTAIVALLQAATGAPEGHATKFVKNITEFGDDGAPVPSKEAVGTVVVNEFSPTNTAKRIQMYEEYVYQDRVNRILFEVDENGNRLGPRELSDEELDVAEAWFRIDPEKPKNYAESIKNLKQEIKGIKTTLSKVQKGAGTKAQNRIKNLEKRIASLEKELKTLVLEQKALKVHGPKTLNTKDRVVEPTLRAPRLVPSRTVTDIDQEFPSYDEYLQNAYQDMLLSSPAMAQFVHDQVIFADNMGFMFGSPRVMGELSTDKVGPGSGMFTPFARIRGKDGEDIPGAVTLGTSTAQVVPGSFGDFMNRAAEMLFPQLLGVSQMARNSWRNAIQSGDFRELSKSWFTDGTQIKDRPAYKKAVEQVEEIERGRGELIDADEKADMIAILYVTSGDEWDATASGNSIMMASQVTRAQLVRYLENDEAFKDLVTDEKRDIDMYLLVKDRLVTEIESMNLEVAQTSAQREALTWWRDTVFSGKDQVDEEVLRKLLFKIPVMARSYGIGYEATKKHVVSFIRTVYIDEAMTPDPRFMADNQVDYAKIDSYAASIAKIMVDTSENQYQGIITKALKLPTSRRLVKQWREGHDIPITYQVLNSDGTPRETKNGEPVMRTIVANFEKAINGENTDLNETALEELVGRIFGFKTPESELEFMGMKTILQLARQASQLARLMEGDAEGRAMILEKNKELKAQGLKEMPTDFQGFLKSMIDWHSSVIEKARQMAEDPNEPRTVAEIVRDLFVAAKQNSLKSDGIKYMSRRVKRGNKDMAQAYSALFGFDFDDMDPRMAYSHSEGTFSHIVSYQENRQETTDGTMGTEITRIRTTEKPGAMFTIESDLYAGKTLEDARKDVRRRAITQALIDASRFRRFDGRQDPTIEDFYTKVQNRGVTAQDTDMKAKSREVNEKIQKLNSRLEELEQRESELSESERNEITRINQKLAMYNAAKDSFLDNNLSYNPNLAHRRKYNPENGGNFSHPETLVNTVSFSQQQDGFHGAFPEYARKSYSEVMGIPSLRQFALTRSRFGRNARKVLEPAKPVVNVSNKSLSEPSRFRNTDEGYVSGSITDLIMRPGLTNLTLTERAVQLEVKIIRAAIAAGKDSHLYNILNPTGGKDITAIEKNGGDITEAYVYLARKEIIERAQRRMNSTIERVLGNTERTFTPDEEQRVAMAMLTIKAEAEKEFETLFSGFAKASMNRETPILQMDPLNNTAKLAKGRTTRDSLARTTLLAGSQAERTNFISHVLPEVQHSTRVIYEGTKGSTVEGTELYAGSRSENAESATAPLMAFHTDSFQIIVPSAFLDRVLGEMFDAALADKTQLAPIIDGISDGTKTWHQLVNEEQVMTKTSAANLWIKHQFEIGNSRNILLAITRSLNEKAGDSGFADIDMINNWGISLTIVDDRMNDIVDPEVVKTLTYGSITIDSKRGKDQSEMAQKLVGGQIKNKNKRASLKAELEQSKRETAEELRSGLGRELTSLSDTFLNGFGDEVRTHKTKGDIKVSLTRNQKAIALSYSKNSNLMLDMQLLNIINVNEMTSRQAESTRVSEYIPDMLMERTDIQQMPAGSLDMHLRHLAQFDLQALKMIQPGRPKVMTDSMQSGMDSTGAVTKDMPAEYISFDDYNLPEIDRKIHEDQVSKYLGEGTKNKIIPSRQKTVTLPQKGRPTPVKNTMTDVEYYASISALYGLNDRLTHLAMAIFGNNKGMQERITSGLGFSFNSILKDANAPLSDIDVAVRKNAQDIEAIVETTNAKAKEIIQALDRKQEEELDTLLSKYPELNEDSLAELNNPDEVYYRVRLFLKDRVPQRFLRGIASRLFIESHPLRKRRMLSEVNNIDLDSILESAGIDTVELNQALDNADDLDIEIEGPDMFGEQDADEADIDAAMEAAFEQVLGEQSDEDGIMDLEETPETPSVQESELDSIVEKPKVELVLQDRIIKLKNASSFEFTSLEEFSIWLTDLTQNVDDLSEGHKQLITLVNSALKIKEDVADLRISFGGVRSGQYSVATDGRTASVEIPTGMSLEKTLETVTHELMHHLVRRSFLTMDYQKYRKVRRSILRHRGVDIREGTKSLDNQVEKVLQGLVDEDTMKYLQNNARKILYLHSVEELEYFLVQEYLAYSLVKYVVDPKARSKGTDVSADIVYHLINEAGNSEQWIHDPQVPNSVRNAIKELFARQGRKTGFEQLLLGKDSSSKQESGALGMTLFDVSSGARTDGGPDAERVLYLSRKISKIEEILSADRNLGDEQKSYYNLLRSSIDAEIRLIEEESGVLQNDRGLAEVAAKATNSAGEIDFGLIHSTAAKQELATRALAELGIKAEFADVNNPVQQMLDTLGVSTTGMNGIRQHKLHIIRALGAMLNPEQYFAMGRFGATRGMVTLQGIMLMENGQVDRVAYTYTQTLDTLKEKGMGVKSLNELLHKFMTIPDFEKHLDPETYAIIAPLGKALKNYYSNVAIRAYKEGLISLEQRNEMMKGKVPITLTSAALDSADAISAVQAALVSRSKKALNNFSEEALISPVAMIGSGILPSTRADKNQIIRHHSEELNALNKMYKNEDIDWNSVLISELHGLVNMLKADIRNGKVKIKDLPPILREKYQRAVEENKPLNADRLQEMHDDLDIGYVPRYGITAAEYHAGRALWHLKNDSYAFEDKLLSFDDITKDDIIRPYVEFNPLRMINGLRKGLSFSAYERFLVRKNLGIRGAGFRDLIDYTETVIESGTNVPTIEEGEVVTRALTTGEMKGVQSAAIKNLRLHRDHARGKRAKPESGSEFWDGFFNVSNEALRFFGQPFWTTASLIVEGGLSFFKQISRALRGPIIEIHKAFMDLSKVNQSQALEMLGIYTYSVGASIDNAKFGGQDVASLDVIFEMVEAEVAGDPDGAVKSRLKRLGRKAQEGSRLGFDPLQRLLRSVEVQPAINKLGRDIRHFSKFIKMLDSFVEQNKRSPDKAERFQMMRDSGLGNTGFDLHRVNKYIDSGLMNENVKNALINIVESQAGQVFSFDEAMHKFVTFGGKDAETNLQALMAFRQYLVMEATDTNLEVGVGDQQVIANTTTFGRLLTRLTTYATLAYRMFRNLLFAAPASVIASYFAGYYMLENLYTSFARIARGSDWREEVKRWTAFQEKPAETVATYLTAGIALPQIGGQLSTFASSSVNYMLNKVFGLDTPGYLMTPGGASTTGITAGVESLGSLYSISRSILNEETVNQKDVSKVSALGSFAGLPYVFGRAIHSFYTQEQVGLEGQRRDAAARGTNLPIRSIESLYPRDTSTPSRRPLDTYQGSPVFAKPDQFATLPTNVPAQTETNSQVMAGTQQPETLPQRVPRVPAFGQGPEEAPSSLF